MPRMKWANSFKGLPDDPEEWQSEYDDYDGPEPRGNLVLAGYVTKIWATESQAGNDMLKVIFVAKGNGDERKKFNGWPCWDNIVFQDNMGWRYGPFLEALGIELADVERRTVVGDEDGNGFPIKKIGDVSLAKPIPVRIKTKIENSEEYGRSTKIAKWLLPKDADEDADDFDDEDEEWEEADEDDEPF